MESNSNPSNIIKVSAPGKIHLIGEHSVVYGKPAILAAINLRFTGRIYSSKKKQILGIIQHDDAIEKFQINLEKLITKKFALSSIPNYTIKFNNDLPIGSGLGSSAAFCAVFTSALLKFLNINFDLKTLNQLVYEGEKIFQGNPSGGDNTVVVYGGLIWFKKGEKHNTISNKFALNFLLIDSGRPHENTSEMVEHVSHFAKQNKLRFDEIISNQESLTSQMKQALSDNSKSQLFKIVKLAETNLESLGVVGQTACAIIREIENLKGAAKITGAGGIKKGSGMILAFHQNINILIEFAKKNNLKYYSVQISETGVI
jgi:mevalonate kinase